jgi:uncharacterized coiled-coil DUF342 family protein
MDYSNQILEIENNIKKINELHDNIAKKSNEVNSKIDMLNNKKNLKLDDSTQLLVFQNKIIHNELVYLNNHRNIINSSLNIMLTGLSENITMMALSVITMNRDIINNENCLVKHSTKKDEVSKIVGDIIHNLNLINNIIIHIRKYNSELTETIKSNNLHCNTLPANLEFICGHIELEYNKHKNDVEKILAYFIICTKKIIEQNEHMILLKFVS